MRVPAALLLSLVCAAPSTAQQWQPAPLSTVPTPAPVVTRPLTATPWGWNPTAGYIEPGQDEPGYRQWIARQPWRAQWVGQFHRYLDASGVSFVAPTWQLLRTASDWRRCGAEPFEVPPAEEWPNIVNTLRYVRDHVVPFVGAVEPVSVFRNAALNRCAGGAPESVHKSMSAIDFVPLSAMSRDELIRRLCGEHQRQGPRFNAGLGFYSKMRFHVDSWKYRTWGSDEHGHAACPKVQWQPPVLASAPTQPEPGSPARGSFVFRSVVAPTTAPAPTTPTPSTSVSIATPAPTAKQEPTVRDVAGPPTEVSSDPLAPL